MKTIVELTFVKPLKVGIRMLVLSFEFIPQDLWIGAFWQKRNDVRHIYLCLIPCFPLHVQWQIITRPKVQFNEVNDNFLSIEQDPDTSTVAICAVRYCIGRRTYMPSLVTAWVKRHWYAFKPGTRKVMLSDLDEAIKSNRSLGDPCDRSTWTDFHEWVSARIKQ